MTTTPPPATTTVPDSTAQARIAWLADSLFVGALLLIAVGSLSQAPIAEWGLWAGLAGLALRPFTRERFVWSPFLIAIGAWMLASVVSDLVNGLSWAEADRSLGRMWRLFVPLVVLNATATARRWRPVIVGVLLATAAVSVGLALEQRGSGIDRIYPDRDMQEWFVESAGVWRANGLVDHPLTLGGVSTMLAALCLILAVHGRGVRWRWRGGLLAAVLVLLLGLVAAGSRGYLLVFALVAGLLLLTVRARWLLVGGMLLLAGIAVVGSRPAVHDRFARLLPQVEMPMPEDGERGEVRVTFREPDRVARLYFGVQVVADHPLFGVGRDYDRYWAAFIARARDWRDAHGHRFGGYHVHNAWLQAAIEAGLIGLVAYIAIFVALLRTFLLRAIRGAFADRDPTATAWALAGLFVVVAFMAAGFFENNWEDSEVQVLLWLLVGLCLWPTTTDADAGGPGKSADNDAGTSTRASPAPDRRWPLTGWILFFHAMTFILAASALSAMFDFSAKIQVLGVADASRESVAITLLVLAMVSASMTRREVLMTRRRITGTPVDSSPELDGKSD